MMNSGRPKVRNDLDFFPVQSSGKKFILIQDRLGLIEKGKGISPELFNVITTLDGKHSVRDIQLDLIRQQGGSLIPLEDIEAILEQLDDSYILDSPRYQEARKDIIARFTAQEVRYASHAGLSYPRQQKDLRERLESILSIADAPPRPPGKITALVAPHIDLEAGKRVYASAYQVIKGIAPQRVIVLGVGHSMANDIFSLTAKTFETPLGRVETDHEIVKELLKAGDEVIARNDFVHKDEHSIEFQLVFLQHVFGDSHFTIVPILCGSLLGSLTDYSREMYRSTCSDFLRILSDAARDKDTLIVAGVDFSHVGPKFGHDSPATFIIDESERHDRQLLQSLCAMNAEEFWSESKRVEDGYNVCGFSALACLLEVLPQSRGTLLRYEVFKEAPTESAVSFGAAVFTN